MGLKESGHLKTELGKSMSLCTVPGPLGPGAHQLVGEITSSTAWGWRPRLQPSHLFCLLPKASPALERGCLELRAPPLDPSKGGTGQAPALICSLVTMPSSRPWCLLEK